MGKVEQVLKAEIGRLARKETKTAFKPIRRDVRLLKQAVAQLNKTVRQLQQALRRQPAGENATAAIAPVNEAGKQGRLSPILIKKLRKRLNITQAELAVLADVSAGAVAFWESGRSRPRGVNRARLITMRQMSRREVKARLAQAK
jgi:DNA-binding transcriptional regulator YiaG